MEENGLKSEGYPQERMENPQMQTENLRTDGRLGATPDAWQRIFYGAPGTGKSYLIDNDPLVQEANAEGRVFRTTFHPDSDYSTFVGAYKPTMVNSTRALQEESILSRDAIKRELLRFKASVNYPCQRLGVQYWRTLETMSARELTDLVLECGLTANMLAEINKGKSVGRDICQQAGDERIAYAFVEQVFLKAYVRAWREWTLGASDADRKPVFLVIEEINRGNCAQIFGDLFQLLDRRDGFSRYPIDADEDLRRQLEKDFGNLDFKSYPEVKSGRKLILPPNLRIWATMNTSDQSLFPMDSAFKRRWNWKYVPIRDAKLGWKIRFAVAGADGVPVTREVDWWKFIQKVNGRIYDATQSEARQLGYFFCPATERENATEAAPTLIAVEQFVDKVLFYLWNDVFRGFGDRNALCSVREGRTRRHVQFHEFYGREPNAANPEGIDHGLLARFLENVMADSED